MRRRPQDQTETFHLFRNAARRLSVVSGSGSASLSTMKLRKSPEGRCNPGDKALGLAGNGIQSGVWNSKGLHAQRMPENTSCFQCF